MSVLSLTLTSPVIVANIIGATVFLVLAIVYLVKAHGEKSPWDMEAAKIFSLLFAALGIATSIAVSKK